MKKFICIILFVFIKTIFLGDLKAYAHYQTSDDRSLIVSPSVAVQAKKTLKSEEPEKSPRSKRKKRIKGISYEFLPIISKEESVFFNSCENQLCKYYLSISYYHHFCNGKRGPPSVSSLH